MPGQHFKLHETFRGGKVNKGMKAGLIGLSPQDFEQHIVKIDFTDTGPHRQKE